MSSFPKSLCGEPEASTFPSHQARAYFNQAVDFLHLLGHFLGPCHRKIETIHEVAMAMPEEDLDNSNSATGPVVFTTFNMQSADISLSRKKLFLDV